ncbi:MAG: GNAT family N-acetyltransferase [Nocardioides sp.]|uniref:GNAT family N-acetyltransferase n=1 Tax=Nocardioides sp. TaxID=35761 RepID=UPI0039E676EC
MTTHVSVAPGFDSTHWNDDGSLYRSVPWIESMGSRVGDLPYSVTVSDGEGGASLLGYLHEPDPDRYEAFNLAALLARTPPVFPVEGAIDGAVRDVVGPGATAATEAALGSCLVIALPGYGDPLGQAATEPVYGERLLSATVDFATEREVAMLALLYVPQRAEVTTLLEAHGFRRFSLTRRAELPLPPEPGMAAWLESLGSSKRRREMSRQQRRIRELGLRTYRSDGDRARAVVVDLRVAHLEQLGQVADRARERERLERLQARFPDSEIRLTEYDGNPVGASVTLTYGRTTHVVLSAVDHGVAPPLTFFEVTYYAIIRERATLSSSIDLGIGHLEGKVARGAVLRELDGWVRPVRPRCPELLGRILDARCTGTADPTTEGVPRATANTPHSPEHSGGTQA